MEELPAHKRRRTGIGTKARTGAEPSHGPWICSMGLSYDGSFGHACLPPFSEDSHLPHRDAAPGPGISSHADLGAASLDTSHYTSTSPNDGTASLYTGLDPDHGTASPYTSLYARYTTTAETDTVFGSIAWPNDAHGRPSHGPWLAAAGDSVGCASGVTGHCYHGGYMHCSGKGLSIDPHALPWTNHQARDDLIYATIDSSLSPGSSGSSSSNSRRSQSQSASTLESGSSVSSDFQTAPLLGQTRAFDPDGYINGHRDKDCCQDGVLDAYKYSYKDSCTDACAPRPYPHKQRHRLVPPPLLTNTWTPTSAFSGGQAQPQTSGQDIRYSVTTSATACFTGPCVTAPEAQDRRPPLTDHVNPGSSLGSASSLVSGFGLFSGSSLGFAGREPLPAFGPAATNATYDLDTFWPPQPPDFDEFFAAQQLDPLQLPLQSHGLFYPFYPIPAPGPYSPSSVQAPGFLVEPFLSASLSVSSTADMARGIIVPQWPRNHEHHSDSLPHSDSVPSAGQAPSGSPVISGVTSAGPGIFVPLDIESPKPLQELTREAQQSDAALVSAEGQEWQWQKPTSIVDVNKALRGLPWIEFDFDSTPIDGFELIHCNRKHRQLDQHVQHVQPDGARQLPASARTEKTKSKDVKSVDFRSKKTCLRCRVQKLRCQYDIQDDAADCRACRLFSKTSRKTIHHIACYRGKLISTVLFRQGGLNLTQRWQGTDIKDVGDRVLDSPIRTIYVKLGLCDVTLELHVVEFHPVPTDVLHRSWHYIDSSSNKLRARKKLLPAFCLHSACRTAAYFEKYVCQQATRAFINEGIDSHMPGTQPPPVDIIKRTYKMAISHYESLGTDKDGTWEKLATIEKNLLGNIFILWFAIRNTMGSSFIVGSETLGMVPELVVETYPLFGKVSVPRMITAQCDSIIHQQLLVKYGRRVLQDLEVLIFSNNRRWWWTIYTCTFIFLREASLITADRYRHARSNYGTRLRYSIPKFVEELQEGCNNLLMHWHYFNCKPWPDASKTIHRRQYPYLSDEQCELIRDTITDGQIQSHLSIWKRYKDENGFVDPPSMKPQDTESTPYCGTQAAFEWDHSLYWVSQMFEEKWQPHPIYQRERVPDPAPTDSEPLKDSLDISLNIAFDTASGVKLD